MLMNDFNVLCLPIFLHKPKASYISLSWLNLFLYSIDFCL